MAHEYTNRTSWTAEIPPPAEATLRTAPQSGAAAFCDRAPLQTPLEEESHPFGLSGLFTHAPCRPKESLSLKLKCRAPQLPPAFFPQPKKGLGLKKLIASS